MHAVAIRIGVIMLIGIAGLLSGCSKQEDAPTAHRIEGIVQSIDATASTISVRFTPPKGNREVSRSGTVLPGTEIQINGVVSSLADLHIGERVIVTGYVKSHGDEQELIARRIEATRAQTIRKAPVAKPEPKASSEGDAQNSSTGQSTATTTPDPQ